MALAQHWIIGIMLLLLGIWLLWVWFGFEPDLTKNPRSLHFASSAAYADFLTLAKPNLEARRLRFLKQVDYPIFVEIIKLGFRQLVADDLQVELTTDKLAFTVIALRGINGERLLVACCQGSLRKNPTWANEFGHLCQINQVSGLFIHLGVTNRSHAVHLGWACSIHLLSGSRLIYLLTRQDNRLAWLFQVLETNLSTLISARITT
ncbi:hypothetical protein [Spirosoma luteum]|uniref:hypothetical protein n=1 Tax=Spirosoma luteum TaxID=431553 RepID=UPI000373494E|nr:hypothetical protein [Spirosoma luteum]